MFLCTSSNILSQLNLSIPKNNNNDTTNRSGCIVCAFWSIANLPEAPPPSIGFPAYVYPDQETCDLYSGVPCVNDVTKCCYNEDKWCPSPDNCRADNGAYPFGDLPYYPGQMLDSLALTPFPNAIFWNWATIFILGFGNLAALDFQVRVMAAKSPRDAQIGCFVAGCITLLIGVPFAYFGGMTRYYYGPDSIHAEFNVDTCSPILGLPTCGAWIPDKEAFIYLMTHQVPAVLGAWCLIGIVAASMSTASGAILAMGTVFSHNIMRQLDAKYPTIISSDNLLFMTRVATVPFTIISALIASNSQKTGYLLIVAFDIVLASVVPTLVFGFYLKHKSSCAALCSVLTGVIMRVTLEFALPKDGFLILPFNGDEYLNYGSAASTGLPIFMDGEAGTIWDPATEQCVQERFTDYTGVDSLSSCFGAILSYLIVYMIEVYVLKLERPLFTFPGMVGYYKDIFMEDDVNKKALDTTKPAVFNDDSVDSSDIKQDAIPEDENKREC
jgi:Sodium:solute symporter family